MKQIHVGAVVESGSWGDPKIFLGPEKQIQIHHGTLQPFRTQFENSQPWYFLGSCPLSIPSYLNFLVP